MKTLSIVFACALVALASCTKSKEVHPEVGDGNDEIVTVGIDNVHIKYIRNDIASLQKVMFNYSLADEQQFGAAEMTKKSDCFELTLNNLESDTLYSYYYEVFPYSGNSYQTVQKSFRTQFVDTVQPVPPTPPSGVPTGAISGLFTINENGDQVYFSQGNLQYQASTNTWRFAENQWDYVGEENTNISPTYDGWIDLFGWGTSGWNSGNIYYQPWDISNSNADYYGPPGQYDLTGQYANSDWGVYNSIINGGNTVNQWRTLKMVEWSFVLYTRITTSGIRYAKAQINGVKGVILLPDDWDSSIYNLNSVNTGDASFSDNIISIEQWSILDNVGAVFFPAAGYRIGHSIYSFGSWGEYWSASWSNNNGGHNAHGVYFDHLFVYTNDYVSSTLRCYGRSVRLVQDANK